MRALILLNYYSNKESVFITASKSYILTRSVNVSHTWVRTLRCIRCCLCQESGRPPWFFLVTLRKGHTTERTSCSRMSPELGTQTQQWRTITSKRQRAQSTAENRTGLGMSWGFNPLRKLKWNVAAVQAGDFPALFYALISLSQQTHVSTNTDMMSKTFLSIRFHRRSV